MPKSPMMSVSYMIWAWWYLFPFLVERLEADDNKILAAQSLEEDFDEPLNTGETLSQVVPKFV